MMLPAIRSILTTATPGLSRYYTAASAPTTANFAAGAGQEAVERVLGVSVPEATPIGSAASSIYNYFADIVEGLSKVDTKYGAKLEADRLAKSEAMWKKDKKK